MVLVVAPGQRAEAGDTVDGGDVVPGWGLVLAELFA